MDLRRLATAAAICIAAFATLATSATMPTPPPTIENELGGTLELSPESPVGIQEVAVSIDGVDLSGARPTVAFEPAAAPRQDGQDALRLGIVAAEPGARDAFDGFRTFGPEGPPPRSWPLDCAGSSCEGRFALVVEWEDPVGTDAATIDWTLAVAAELWSGVEGGQPSVSVTALDPGDGRVPGRSVTRAAGDGARLDALDRLAQWRVVMTLGEGPLDADPGWPVVAVGRLVPRSEPVAVADSGEAGRPLLFIEGTGATEGAGIETSRVDDLIEFDPFTTCVAGEPCSVEYVVGVIWPDGRPDSAADAGWDLDVRVVDADGAEPPVAIAVEPVAPMKVVIGTASGTLVFREGTSSSYRYRIDDVPAGPSGPAWGGLRLPTYGVWRATITSTGDAPLPDDFAVNFGPNGGSYRVPLGEEQSFGFVPDRGMCRAANPCEIEGNLSAGFDASSLPARWEFRIDWEMEIGVGTTASESPAGLRIVEVPPPSSQP